jgi:hypothetical protein
MHVRCTPTERALQMNDVRVSGGIMLATAEKKKKKNVSTLSCFLSFFVAVPLWLVGV